MKHCYLLAFVLFFFATFSSQGQTIQVQPPQALTEGSPNPLNAKMGIPNSAFVNLRMSITAIETLGKAKAYKIEARYQGKVMGFVITFQPSLTDSGTPNKVFRIDGLGKESDYFLTVLARKFEEPAVANRKFTDSVTGHCTDLYALGRKESPKHFDASTWAAHYKIFFEDSTHEAELFLNLDPQERWIEISEKDNEYRPVLIYFLTKR